MKQNVFVIMAVLGFAFLTHVFCGGISLPFWQQVVGFSVCLVFWLMMLAPAFDVKSK